MIAIFYLPLSDSQSLLSCAVFATMLLGYFILDENLSTREIVTICGGVAGILILINPQYFNFEKTEAKISLGGTKSKESTKNYMIGLIFALLFSVFSSMKLISIRAIGENVHSSIKNFYFGVIGFFVMLVVNAFLQPEFYKFWLIGTNEYVMNLQQLTAYIVVALFGWASQECLARGLSIVQTGTIAAF